MARITKAQCFMQNVTCTKVGKHNKLYHTFAALLPSSLNSGSRALLVVYLLLLLLLLPPLRIRLPLMLLLDLLLLLVQRNVAVGSATVSRWSGGTRNFYNLMMLISFQLIDRNYSSFFRRKEINWTNELQKFQVQVLLTLCTVCWVKLEKLTFFCFNCVVLPENSAYLVRKSKFLDFVYKSIAFVGKQATCHYH